MELLRSHPQWQSFGSQEALSQFVNWVGSTLLPPTDAWVAFKTPPPQWGHDGNVYANWYVFAGPYCLSCCIQLLLQARKQHTPLQM
jgi:hypothetical protein